MTYPGNISSVLSSSFIWDGSKLQTGVLNKNSASLNTYINVANRKSYAVGSPTAVVVGQAELVPCTDIPTGSIKLQTVMSVGTDGVAAIRLYNVLSGTWVQLDGTGSNPTVLTVTASAPTLVESMDLWHATNFDRTYGIYELVTYLETGTTEAIDIYSSAFLCSQPENALLYTSLENGTTADLTFTRAAGPYSYQVSGAVDGTTFIVTGSTVNKPRFQYIPALARSALLIEPARTNVIPSSSLVDTSPANNVPDGWTVANGSAGTHWEMYTSNSPYAGGTVFTYLDVATPIGVAINGVSAASASYVGSSWVRMIGTTGSVRMFKTYPEEAIVNVDLVGGPSDWRKISSSVVTSNVTIDTYGGLLSNGRIGADVAMPQVEAGTYASTWIPTTSGSEIRPAERLTIAANKMPRTAGTVEFDWVPGFASTDDIGIPATNVICLFSWADNIVWPNGSSIVYYWVTRKLYTSNNSSNAISSQELTFTPWNNVFHIKYEFGSFGRRMTVNGTVTAVSANPWVAPTAGTGCLGSESDGGGIGSSAFANLKLTGT